MHRRPFLCALTWEFSGNFFPLYLAYSVPNMVHYICKVEGRETPQPDRRAQPGTPPINRRRKTHHGNLRHQGKLPPQQSRRPGHEPAPLRARHHSRHLDKVLTDFKARAQLFGTESEQHQEFMRLLEEADFTIITMGTSNFPKNGEVSSWSVMFSN